MISGKKKINLTVELILSKITPYDIFKYYMPHPFKLNVKTFSPFREEKHPSFIIGTKHGEITYIDFADTSKRGSCFNFVKTLFGINYTQTLKLIDKDFHLNIGSNENTEDYKIITSTYEQPENVAKRYSTIQVITRAFTNFELEYWNQYHQDVSDLKANNIYAIKKLYLNKGLFHLDSNELSFGYLYKNRWKIYRPFADKKHKWLPNNVPITAMDGKEDIKDCNVAFINKSKKDYMVIKKIFPCTCAVQNEGLGCFSPENVDYIKTNSGKQILSFDSDMTGVENSQQITKMFDFGYCNVPRKYLSEGIKDWADLGKIHGMKAIEEYLKHKELL